MSLNEIFDIESAFSNCDVATTATVATIRAGIKKTVATELLLPATISSNSPLVQKIVATSSSPVAARNPSPVDLVAGVAIVAGGISENHISIPNTKLTIPTSNIPDDLQHWITLVQQANTPEEVFDILANFKPLQWTDAQRAAMSRCYVPILERFYKDNPDGWFTDGRLATPQECIQAEKARRGWYWNNCPIRLSVSNSKQ